MNLPQSGPSGGRKRSTRTVWGAVRAVSSVSTSGRPSLAIAGGRLPGRETVRIPCAIGEGTRHAVLQARADRVVQTGARVTGPARSGEDGVAPGGPRDPGATGDLAQVGSGPSRPARARPSPPRRRVLLCGPGWRLKFETFFHVFDKALLNGLCRAGHQVRHFSDRDTADAVFFGWRRLGRPAVQRRLRRAVERFEPDILLLVHADLVELATLRDIRRAAPALIVASVDCDPLLPEPRERLIRPRAGGRRDLRHQRRRDPAPALRRADRQRHFVPNPLDPAILDPARYAESRRRHDLAYPTRAKERLRLHRYGAPRRARSSRCARSGGMARRSMAGRSSARSRRRGRRSTIRPSTTTSIRRTGSRSSTGWGSASACAGPAAIASFWARTRRSGTTDPKTWPRSCARPFARAAGPRSRARGARPICAQFDSGLVADYLVARLTGSDPGDLAWAEGGT